MEKPSNSSPLGQMEKARSFHSSFEQAGSKLKLNDLEKVPDPLSTTKCHNRRSFEVSSFKIYVFKSFGFKQHSLIITMGFRF